MADLYRPTTSKEEDAQDKSAEVVFESTSNQNGYSAEGIIAQDLINQINKKKLDLSINQIFQQIPFYKNVFKRKNILYHCISEKELSIDVFDTIGTVYLPLITKEEINKRLSKIKERSQITTIHLGAIKMLFTAHFRNGIESPLKMALIDDRIIDRQDCILGAARGTLAYGKFMFTVNPQYPIDIKNRDLNKVLSFIHEFERPDFMRPGNRVFSVTYKICYALSNSVHSVAYKDRPTIELDDVFKQFGDASESPFCPIDKKDCSWAIDIASNKPAIGSSSRTSTSGNSLRIGERRSQSMRLPSGSSQTQMLTQVANTVEAMRRQLEDLTQ